MYSDVRLDWISVLEGPSRVKVVCQLCGLWELRVTKEACLTNPVSFFYFSCVPSKLVNMPRTSTRIFKAFTTLQYNLWGRDKTLTLITDKVDLIVSPEVVVPVSMKKHDYVVSNSKSREDCKFYHIPYSFLLREDWGHDSVNLNATLNETIKLSPSSRLYLQTSRFGRDEMFDKLIAVTEILSDSAIIQGAVLQSR